MKVKVCGMRSIENIERLLKLPIDFIGFIFYGKSSRNIKEEEELIAWIEKNEEAFGDIKKVGVFVNSEIDFILNKLHDFKLDYIQLHGSESANYCKELQSFWTMTSMRKAQLIKAFSIGDKFDFSTTMPYSTCCSYFIFDTKVGDQSGGTGKKFDWSLLNEYHGITPFLLSGGIDVKSAAAIKTLDFPQMAGIDINSRFELEPALKDVEMIDQFLKEL